MSQPNASAPPKVSSSQTDIPPAPQDGSSSPTPVPSRQNGAESPESGGAPDPGGEAPPPAEGTGGPARQEESDIPVRSESETPAATHVESPPLGLPRDADEARRLAEALQPRLSEAQRVVDELRANFTAAQEELTRLEAEAERFGVDDALRARIDEAEQKVGEEYIRARRMEDSLLYPMLAEHAQLKAAEDWFNRYGSDTLPSPDRRPVRGRDVLEDVDVVQAAEFTDPAYIRGPADPALGQIYRHQGFDGLPAVTDSNGVDAVIAAGGIEFFRGVTDAVYVRDFKQGPYFPGRADGHVMGNGTYVSTGRLVAEGSARENPEGVMRMALRPDARVTHIDRLKVEHDVVLDGYRKERDRLEQMERTPEVAARLQEVKAAITLYGDLGRFAAARGYDAYALEHGYYRDTDVYWVVLNRTALVVQDTPYVPSAARP